MDKSTCCEICKKEFFKVSNLRRHTKRFHPESYVPLPKKQFAFTCENCGKNFSYFRNYKCHMKIHNPNPPLTKTVKNCPLCDFASDKQNVYGHFQNFHKIQLITEHINFPTFNQFITWKMSLENDTKVNFNRAYSQQTKYFDEVILFVCDRSGHHLYKAKNPNKSKTDVVTKKIGGFCPASIKMMKKNDGSIKVSYLRTHIGHSNEDNLQNGEPKSKSKIMLLRHRDSMNLSAESLTECDTNWKYHSKEKEETYIISKNNNECVYDCTFVCEDCRTCIHRFSCTCKDWTVKWNMCAHIHLLCRTLNEKERHQLQSQQLQHTNTKLDFTDLIIYDTANHEPVTLLHEVQAPAAVSIEDKNLVLQEFSDLLIKCESPALFQEIVSLVGGLKARLDCEDLLAPITHHFGNQ